MLLHVDHVSKHFIRGEYATSLRDTIGGWWQRRGRGLPSHCFYALQDVNFQVQAGEMVALIGTNGSGKSTLLRVIANILRPNQGQIKVQGRISALIEMITGMHPDLTGHENIFLVGAFMGMGRHEINRQLQSIIDFSGLQDFMDTPLKRYSSGMSMRLGFSVAIHVNPDLLLLDEILAVGDGNFQKQCIDRVLDMVRDKRRGVIIVTHNMSIVSSMCSRVILLDQGRLLMDGRPDAVIHHYEQLLAQKRQAQPVISMSQAPRNTTVSIDNLEFLNAAGQVTRRFSMDEKIQIRIHGHCQEPLRQVIFTVCIDRYDGLRCGLWNSGHERLVDLPRGEFTTELTLPNLPLLPGAYDFKFSIADADYLSDYTQRTGEYVTITAARLYDDRYGVVQLPAQWRLP